MFCCPLGFSTIYLPTKIAPHLYCVSSEKVLSDAEMPYLSVLGYFCLGFALTIPDLRGLTGISGWIGEEISHCWLRAVSSQSSGTLMRGGWCPAAQCSASCLLHTIALFLSPPRPHKEVIHWRQWPKPFATPWNKGIVTHQLEVCDSPCGAGDSGRDWHSAPHLW